MNEIQRYMLRILDDHRGPDRALRRKNLLIMLRMRWATTTDREMRRQAAATGYICKCERGYYLPRKPAGSAAEKQDVDYCVEYLKKKIFPIWEFIQLLRSKYPSADQGDLFADLDAEDGDYFDGSRGV